MSQVYFNFRVFVLFEIKGFHVYLLLPIDFEYLTSILYRCGAAKDIRYTYMI